MKGFRDSTKIISGHHFARGGGVIAHVPRAGNVRESVFHPIIPRPHVMPNMKSSGSMPKMAKLARGGRAPLEARERGGYGHSLSHPVPYSEIEGEHPRDAARPGYKKGGMHINPKHKGKFTRAMGKKEGHLTGADVQRGLHSKSGLIRKEANFARMARRDFKPLHKAKGGGVSAPQVRRIADRS
jgi:hypothetical protein